MGLKRGIKNLIQAGFRAGGYEVHRRGNIGRSMRAALEHVRRLGFRPATVIDVSVGDGTPELYDVFPEARFLLVEAMVEYEPALRRIARGVRADYVIAVAEPQPGTACMPGCVDSTSK